ncbi:alpha-mannosidase [Protaetiibacter sp. SSC-01]|uniref:alpha-mannosidase n=1 Tax=Protaetiibacter sp. SSC-01 TaxID=2759943 RepID=UPI001656B968|nr:glycoside hydrolase family 38 C-terminal domain-containing protein [Protaetiibacter sp. SSC-01]QNO37353.1 alpha-mannosidase [Protaetiibacter sp. SSC-01]
MAGFLPFLLGIRVEQPAQYRRLRRIRSRIYETVAWLDAEVVRSAEPIPFGELDREAFQPIRPGQSFGGVLECAWLRLTGEVPADAGGAIVMLGVRGEGLVHDAEGRIVGAVTTVFQQGDLPHAGGRYRPVGEPLAAGTRVELYADVAYNGFILYEVGRGVFHGARLARRDDTVFGLYYDYLTLAVLAGATDDQTLAYGLRTSLDEAWHRFRAGDAAGARTALAIPLAKPSASELVFLAVGHSHLDMAWLWPLRETRRKAARTYTRALETLDRRPDYVYGTSQPQQLAWMKAEQPDIFDRIRSAVRDGRLELQGTFWVEPDTNLPAGEALIRQATVGRRFLREEFGLDDELLRICWLPDTFGYSGQLPQILRGAGMDRFVTIKLAWNKTNVFPHRTFRWHGIDGTDVLVHMPPEGDYNSRGAADNLLTAVRQYPERPLGQALLVYGSGDGGGGPGEVHLEVLEREIGPGGQGIRGLPRVEFSTARAFFERLERHPAIGELHAHRGELYLEAHQGTYTTQGATKRHNRTVERMLHDVEALSVASGVDTRAELAPVWREVLLHQFHDILPGSAIERVNREARETYVRLEGELDSLAERMLSGLATSDVDTIVNLTSFPRDEHVRVDGAWHRAIVEPYAAARLEPAPGPFRLTALPSSISNGLVELRFDDHGVITSFTDAAGTQHAGGGLGRLVVHRDPYQWPFDAWDIDPRYAERRPRQLRLAASETRIDGPTVVREQRLTGPGVEVAQRIVLEHGSELVRFETRVDWRASHRMLRAEFRPSRWADEASCEIQFGHIRRPTTERDSVERAQFEVVAHKWIAVEDERGGFALLNDGKYGHRAKNGLLSLNLLRSPTFPDRTADRGVHEFTYAMRPFAAGGLGDVIRDGYRLNNPLRRASGVEFASLVASSDPGVVIETVKRADEGDGVVVRLYESLGRPATTALTTRIPHSRAMRVDLLERAQGEVDLERLELRPFEILSILLEP